jgi:hypothetical protein
MQRNHTKNIYHKFYRKKNSHSIANQRALELLSVMTQLNNSNFPILEIGAGIGTISETLLITTNNEIFAQEYDEACRDQLKKISKKFQNRLNVSGSIVIQAYKFIIIDGPYSKKEMYCAIKASRSTLKWIAIENGRTATRIQIAASLFKARYRQSTVEFRRQNYAPSLTFFYVDNPPYRQHLQIFMDLLFTLGKYWPKYLKLLSRKGASRHFKVGEKREGEFGKI